MNSNDRMVQLLESAGAIIRDNHIVYSSGKHGKDYVNFGEVLVRPRVAVYLAKEMARLVVDLDFDTIVGPTHSGDKFAARLADELTRTFGKEIYCVYAQEKGEGREFPRGQGAYVAGKRVLLVDDVLTTGGTLTGTMGALTSSEIGATIVAIVVGCNRSNFREGVFQGYPLLSLVEADLEQWEAGSCPRCRIGSSIDTTVGHGKSFLAEFGQDPSNWPTNKGK